MKDLIEPKFKRGDLVMHRASYERGVVMRCEESCISHGGSFESIGLHMRGIDCEYAFNGYVALSTDMDRDKSVHQDFLELVPKDE